jgi:ABC-type lipoprotein export system ATPase subunit
VVRALINNPDIILADEPTGSLDQKSAEQVAELLVEIQRQQNIALIVVTHSNELASKMKIRYQLMDGKLAEL